MNLLKKIYFSITEAAKLLNTNCNKVRKCLSTNEAFDNKYIIQDSLILENIRRGI